MEFNDLEWLRWDQTLNMSIMDATGAYAADGWRVATEMEVAALFNNFFIADSDLYYISSNSGWSTDPTPFGGDENNAQSTWSAATHENYDVFVDLFGLTDYYCDPDEFWGCEAHTAALFGDDLDSDGLFNWADLYYVAYPDDSNSTALLDKDKFTATDTRSSLEDSNFRSAGSGVVMVRDVNYGGGVVSAPEINGKNTMLALALLLALVLVRRERSGASTAA